MRSEQLKEVIDMKRVRICNFLIGMTMGAVTALLFAPRSGKRTRALIAGATADGISYVKGCGETVGGAVLGFIEQGRGEIVRQKQGVAQAIKRGTHAYRRAVS